MKNISRNTRFFLIVVGIGILVLLLMGFNNRLSTLNRLAAEAEVVKTQFAQLQATQMVLDTQIAEATSPASVEKWAYEEAHMIREGDHLIAPISPYESTSEPSIPIVATVEPMENWEYWRDLFFDEALP